MRKSTQLVAIHSITRRTLQDPSDHYEFTRIMTDKFIFSKEQEIS